MNDNFIELQNHMSLPDLIDNDSMFNSVFPLEAPPLITIHPDIAAISHKLDGLSLECNIQALQIEVERVKRQKPRSAVSSLRKRMSLPCPEARLLREELQTIQINQNTVNYQLDGEIAKVNTMEFRYFARVHHILTAILPHVVMPPNEQCELYQMLNELIRTLHQYQICQTFNSTHRCNN